MAKPKLEYEVDESHRIKHRWENAFAEIVPENGGQVGKCPSSLDHPKAEELLQEGIWYWGRNKRKTRPERVYNVLEGIPYRAHAMGNRYHGFPDVPSEIPPAIREQLRERAKAQGFEDSFDAWMTRYRNL